MSTDSKYQVSQKIEGEFIGVRQLQNRGRLQVPVAIRRDMGLTDGDHVYWIKTRDGKYCIAKATIIV